MVKQKRSPRVIEINGYNEKEIFSYIDETRNYRERGILAKIRKGRERDKVERRIIELLLLDINSIRVYQLISS